MKISAIILAAGGSRRMKDINKLLVLIKNKPLISLVCETFLDVDIHKLILVIGYQYQNIVELISSNKIEIVKNRIWEKGMMSSIHAGIKRLDSDIKGTFLVLADMPLVSKSTIFKLMEKISETKGQKIVFPTHKKKQGNPVYFPKHYFSQILKLYGDFGCKVILKKNLKDAINVEISSNEIILDLDTIEDYGNIKKYVSN